MTSLKDEINDIIRNYVSAANAGDIDRLISLYMDDGIRMLPDVPAIIGKENIKSHFQKQADLIDVKATMNNEEVRETSDWGFVRGNFSLEITPKGEGEKFKRTGKYLTILEKQADGSWKFAREIVNFDAPPQ